MCDEVTVKCVCTKCGGCKCGLTNIKCHHKYGKCCCTKFGVKRRIRNLETRVSELEQQNRNRLSSIECLKDKVRHLYNDNVELKKTLADTTYWAKSANATAELLCRAVACSPAKARSMATTLRDNNKKLHDDYFEQKRRERTK